jgi:F0F1-type ATP synthase assembly protein I
VAAGDRPPLAEAMRLAQVGTMLVAPMLGLGGIGYFLDGRWGTGPWLMVAGLLLGMAGGFVNFVQIVTSIRKDDGGPAAGAPPKDGPPGGGPRR